MYMDTGTSNAETRYQYLHMLKDSMMLSFLIEQVLEIVDQLNTEAMEEVHKIEEFLVNIKERKDNRTKKLNMRTPAQLAAHGSLDKNPRNEYDSDDIWKQMDENERLQQDR
jgi:hypothetical protein